MEKPSDSIPLPNLTPEKFRGEIMAKFSAVQIKEHAEKIMARFADGWQWSDFFEIIPEIMLIVGTVKGMSNEARYAASVGIADYIIDNTDTPWLPDSMTDPILKKAVRYMIPIIYKAADGKYKEILGTSDEAPAE